MGEFAIDDNLKPTLAAADEETQNKYYAMMARRAPTDLVMNFFQQTPPRVQDAARLAVAELLGNMQKYAEESAVVLRADVMATLLYRLQLTGYMFRNAEYRLSLAESLRQAPALPGSGEARGKTAIEGKIR